MTLEEMKKEEKKFIKMLQHKEMSKNTVKKYTLAINTFINFAEESGYCEVICKDCSIRYKEYLQGKYKPNTSNVYITGLNSYLHYLESDDLRINSLRIQTQNILENCFTIDEYKRMLESAKSRKNNTIYYIMRTFANTGMRIAGLRLLTVQTIKKGSFTVTNKGKTRCLVIPEGLCNELLEFCNERDIKDGYVFKGQKPDKTISQTTVKRWLKEIALLAGIDDKKAYPHNLRHLFAKVFLDKYGNLSELSDILGHTRLETTRIYTRTSIEEKRKKMDDIGL